MADAPIHPPMEKTPVRNKTREHNVAKLARFDGALRQLIDKVAPDRNVLAVVQVGTLDEQTIWRHDALQLWIIEADGVSRRLRSDGNDERIFRILVEL